MKKWMAILTVHLWTISVIAHNQDCALKTACLCATSPESIRYHFDHSSVVLYGQVIELDTVRVADIITQESILTIEKEAAGRSECAKEVLKTRKVIQAKIAVEAVYKGQTSLEKVTVTTPLDEASCGYTEFRAGQHYIIYGTSNKTADAYFLWTFDVDYFQLKPQYSIWTNKCKVTKLVEENELAELMAIKKSLIHN